MLNQEMIEKLNVVELNEWNHLRECYWLSVDEHNEMVLEKQTIDHKECIELARVKANQMKNLFMYEQVLREKYKSAEDSHSL